MKEFVRKTTEYPLVTVFFVLCFAAFISYIVKPDTEFSAMENRYLTGRPSVNFASLADGSFMSNFETFCNEQVPIRNALVKGKAILEQVQLKCENDGIAKGADGYLFDKTLSESGQLGKNISAITNFAKLMNEKGREVYITIAPTAVWINADKLPKGMPVLDEADCSNELSLALNNGNLTDKAHMIYLYEDLKARENEQLYYRTDHHWTTLGAGIAYGKIMEEMGLEKKDISAYEKHERSDFLGTSYAKFKGIGVKEDTIEYYDVPIEELRLEKQTVNTLYDLEKLDTYDKYAAFMYGNDGMYEVITQNAAKAEKSEELTKAVEDTAFDGADLIVVKDSYANCLIPYLAMNFNDIIVVDLRYFGGSLQEVMDNNESARILLMYNWSFVNEDNHFYKLVK